ncbi:FtsX-like permease family protein [Kitasatospora sp. LaBMicrA B282]|uniref:FtsX-like permease family protein n=1 Tax=Kitasatospora sp. LaBMicrA B282 TaxID=3420949 RepID=UPI003D123B26
MRPGRWRVALRIARRDALRAKGRSLLVLAMIALPILGVTGADVVWRSTSLTTTERLDRSLGQADVLLRSHMPGGTVLQAPFAEDGEDDKPGGAQPTAEQQRSRSTDPATLAAQLLPPGSVLTPLAYDQEVVASSTAGQLQTTATEADLADPLWQGRLDLLRGRAPRQDHELAATQAFLDDSGLRIGSTTKLRDLGDAPFTITAVVEYPDELKRSELIAPPGALAALAGASGAAGDGSGTNGAAAGGPGANGWLVRLPAGATVDWGKVQELNRYGFAATSRSVVLHPPARSAVPYYAEQDGASQQGYFDREVVVVLVTVVGMALLEVVLLAGPAFAVGARRSRRQLGLLAAAGGDRAQVRTVVLAGGAVLGLVGTVVGMLLAVLLVVLTKSPTEQLAGQRFGTLRVLPLDLLGIAAVGLGTGLLAALVPAVQAARQDVVAALTGRDSTRPPSKRLTVLGLAMVAGGAALALFGATSGLGSRSWAVLGGSMVAELGMVACTPVLVGLFGRLGRLLPLGPRLALRDSVRHRSRTAPAVAAVMAAVAGSVAVGIYIASSDEQGRQAYQPEAPPHSVSFSLNRTTPDPASAAAQRAAVQRSAPDLGVRADVGSVSYPAGCKAATCGEVEALAAPAARCPLDDGQYHTGVDYGRYAADPRCRNEVVPGRFGSVVVGDTTTLHNLFDVHDSAVEQAVADGEAVVFDPRMLQDGKASIRLQEPYRQGQDPSKASPSHEVTVDAVLAPAQAPGGGLFLGPKAVAALGLTTVDAGSVWLPATAPDSATQQRAAAALIAAGGDSRTLYVERGYQSQRSAMVLALSGMAALVALGAAGIATGLSAADSQRDLSTLAAVGAAPRIRRSLSGFQCAVIAAMGAVLGTVCGAVPAVALRRVQASGVLGGGHPVIAVPWTELGLTLVGLPLLAMLLAAVLTRSRLNLVRHTG